MTDENKLVQEQTKMDTGMVDTTLGDLICAISDAAQEALVDEQDLAEITHIILYGMLGRRK